MAALIITVTVTPTMCKVHLLIRVGRTFSSAPFTFAVGKCSLTTEVAAQ